MRGPALHATSESVVVAEHTLGHFELESGYCSQIERAARGRLHHCECRGGGLQSVHVLSLQTLGTLLDLELNLRSFIQTPVTVSLDGREMHEYIVATGALDESIAFGSVKPLHSTFFFHY